MASSPQLSSQPSTTLVLDGVTVVDVEQGTLVPGQRVVIAGNHIRAVGAASEVPMPRGAVIVAARGQYLIPGLWDMHTHSGHATDIFYPLFLANGVTGIRDAGSQVPLDSLRRWREEILAGTRIGPPRQLLSGQSMASMDFAWLYFPKLDGKGCQRSELLDSPQTCIGDTADARHYVDSLEAAGADMVKLRLVARKAYPMVAAEARRLGLPFGGHAEGGITPAEMADFGASIVDHGATPCSESGMAAEEIEGCRALAERFRQHGTWLVRTIFVEVPNSRPNSQPVWERFQKSLADFWAGLPFQWSLETQSDTAAGMLGAGGEREEKPMAIMERLGLPILAGTDVAYWNELPAAGFSLQATLATYVIEGMTPLAALRSATINPAKMLGATDSLGSVAPGKLADLVLLDADPLADITNTTAIRAVVANGRYFDRAALDEILARARAMRALP